MYMYMYMYVYMHIYIYTDKLARATQDNIDKLIAFVNLQQASGLTDFDIAFTKVCVCMCACMYVCMCVCVCVCVYVCMWTY